MIEIKYIFNDKELKINAIYKFKVSNREFEGRLVSVKTDEIIFDCSEKFNQCLRTHRLWQIEEIEEVKIKE